MEPEKIGGFRIVGRLGAGGMGVVYEGIDDMLGRRAATKVLREETAANETGRQRSLREARAAAAVSEHDDVGTIYEVGEDGETLYLAMELVEGRTLRALVHEDPPDLERTLEIAMDIATVPAHARALSVVS